ncbi:hypothetical protein GCM10023080_002370 [Streptomyces pseudoechinosporeus]
MRDHHGGGSGAADAKPPTGKPLRDGDPRRVGPYALVSVLGSGGMGRVYLGREVSGAGRLAAVKVIRPEYAEDEHFRKRFGREVGALEQVRGPYIARLMGSGQDGDLVWMATEYIPGPTLADAVDEHGPLDAAAAWRLAADLVQAVQAMARAGIVHRDLKPSNVILADGGARVIDLGVAQAADASSITATGHYVGTAAYMSPEHARGKPVTTASDVFSLATTLTYAVTGNAPFGDGTGVGVMHRVAYEPPQDDVLDAVTAADPVLAALITDCLAKEPEQRPTPDALFARAIAHQMPSTGTTPGPGPGPGGSRGRASGRSRTAVGPSPSPAPDPAPVPPVPSAARKPRKLGLLLAGAAVLVTLLVAGGVVSLLGKDDGQASAGSGPTAPSGPALGDRTTERPSASPSATPSKTSATPSAPAAAGATSDQKAESSPRSTPSSSATSRESATATEETEQPKEWTSTVVPAGSSLSVGQSWSTNRISMIMQRDGNLVVYNEDGKATWASRTSGEDHTARFQTDGNLVILNADDKPIWGAGSNGHQGAKLVLRKDGKVVIVDGGTVVWST